MAVGHAERLLPMIDEVMRRSGVAFADLGAIAVTVGPGTFTGVRTGIAAARGLALAAGLPVLGMTSLALIARRADAVIAELTCGSRLAVCMDAGKGQIYAQLFGGPASIDVRSRADHFGPDHFSIDSAPISEPMLATAGDVAAMLAAGRSIVVGSAATVVATLATGLGSDVRVGSGPGQASAQDMLGARLQMLSPVRPLYLRQPDAVASPDQALPRALS